ncbi:hypothetical protein HAX54_046291, partial [Datura stramonium]|nr:hypothetical protein [Datura stramonium]
MVRFGQGNGLNLFDPLMLEGDVYGLNNYLWGLGITISVASINATLGLLNPFEANLKARDVENNSQWLVDTLIVEEKRASSHWGIMHTDIRDTHFTTEAKKGLNL